MKVWIWRSDRGDYWIAAGGRPYRKNNGTVETPACAEVLVFPAGQFRNLTTRRPRILATDQPLQVEIEIKAKGRGRISKPKTRKETRDGTR